MINNKETMTTKSNKLFDILVTLVIWEGIVEGERVKRLLMQNETKRLKD